MQPRQRSHRPHGPAFYPAALVWEEVEQHRHMSCGLYMVCLEVAVRRRWPSFTCTECSLWAPKASRPSQGPATVIAWPAAR